MKYPVLLVADDKKNVFDLPGYQASSQSGEVLSVISFEDLIPLPEGSDLFFLPDRAPVGFNVKTKVFETIDEGMPVAAFLPAGYSRLLNPAYEERSDAKLLPLYAYTPVVWFKGEMHVPALRIDARENHDIQCVDKEVLRRKIAAYPQVSDRLRKHLVNCALVNSCPNAMNLFLGKLEAPLPVSPVCNAGCMGCISFQPEGSCAATQPRLTFLPTPQELADIAVPHLETAFKAVVSFGQGCEGEPLMEASVIEAAIRLIRSRTSKGTIHLNSNASLPMAVASLCKAGLDSLRVSFNSARPEYHYRYYSPQGYTFADVERSLHTAKKYGKFVSCNYLVMPGFTDREDEFMAFAALLGRTGVDMIQWRNLNYDPQAYFRNLGVKADSLLLGMRVIQERLRQQFPKLRHGYFNVPKEDMV